MGAFALHHNIDGFTNNAFGEAALFWNIHASHNTAIGFFALGNNDSSGNGSANENTAVGSEALAVNINGSENTAVGSFTLGNNQASGITAIGAEALSGNTDGTRNTAAGTAALFQNEHANDNTAVGWDALLNNDSSRNGTANGNTAVGSGALLKHNVDGSDNTAVGSQTLFTNTTGGSNTATGSNALGSNTTGFRNMANGVNALYFNTTGSRNTAEGFQALFHNIGSDNVGLGFNAGSNLTTGSGNICIGNGVLGVAGESNTTRIRNIYASVASGRPVYINSDNKIGTLSSSRRYKEEITPMDKASEKLFALKPVTFRYKKEVDAERALSFGLIAEEVAEVSPQLITRDENGNPQTVRYEAINAMLLNEFLKEHRKNEEQQATIARLEKQLETVTATVQKLSAQPKSKPAPQTVLNDQ